jgi:sugar phosphate isomerase/epimerase
MEVVVSLRWTVGTLAALILQTGAGGQTASLPNEFYALDTAVVRNLGRDFIQRSDIEYLKELGYPGLAVCVPNREQWQHLVENVLPWLDESGLKLYAVFTEGEVDREQYSLDPELKRLLPRFKGRDTVIWLPIYGRAFKPSDPAADKLIVALVRDVADAAAQYGLRVSLYPHIGALLERTADAVRIAEAAARKNVGVTLNLCHWLRADGASSMETVMKAALPWLTMVTINGTDREAKEWIQPLDSGDFDVGAFLGALCQLGYRGPIGLQGYAVATTYHIQPVENLRRSMDAWKRLARPAVPGGSPRNR